MGRTRTLLIASFFAMSLVACGTAPAPSSQGSMPATSPGPTVTPSRTNGPTGSAPADGLAQFSTLGLRFAYPAAWHRAEFQVTSSFSQVLVYLSTESLADPCDRSPGSIACTREAVAALGPSGVLVTWTHSGFPGWSFDPRAGTTGSIGGRTATLADLPADEGCQSIGGEALVVATIPTPDARWNWDEMRACLRGPNVPALRAQLQAMLGSVQWQ